MNEQRNLEYFIKNGGEIFIPQLSVDCVVFGFHNNELMVLLLKMKHVPEWGLPGGFVYQQETLETAASRILKERTGLDNIFLRQFHTFSDPNRSNPEQAIAEVSNMGISIDRSNWFAQRFITVGFYALVDFTNVTPNPDLLSVACTWWDLGKITKLIMDHHEILIKALDALRIQMNHQPLGYNLLPEKFTMPELQKLYETILNKSLDRRNFQRKILSYGILNKHEETRTGGAHKAPYLYSFDLKKYHNALHEGLKGEW